MLSLVTGLARIPAGTEVPWLIAIAMFLAYGFRKTGLGQRLAYQFVVAFGRSPMGLTYSLVFRWAGGRLQPSDLPLPCTLNGELFNPVPSPHGCCLDSAWGGGVERW